MIIKSSHSCCFLSIHHVPGTSLVLNTAVASYPQSHPGRCGIGYFPKTATPVFSVPPTLLLVYY